MSSLYSPTSTSAYKPEQSNQEEEEIKPRYVPSEVGDPIPYSPASAYDAEEQPLVSPQLPDDISDGEYDPTEDREYRIESPKDVTTPKYAPSQHFDSPDSAASSVYSPIASPRNEAEQESPEFFFKLSQGSDNPKVKTEAVEFEKRKDMEEEARNEQPDIFGDNDDLEKDAYGGGDDFEGFDGAEQTKGMIADIFGESDAEEEEFEGFAENEVEKEIPEELDKSDEVEEEKSQQFAPQKRHSDEGEEDEEKEDTFVSDFEIIMSKRKEETRRKRRLNKDEDFLNDSDDIIREVITKMRKSAEDDRRLLSLNRPATKKLALLKVVSSLLEKADLKPALIDNGMLGAITEWLSPISGQALPNVIIRDTLLKHLADFDINDPEILKECGIGKAVMYLYKHPRETRENKQKAGHLINEWSRPIFNLTSDYRTLTKEERKQLDYEHLPKRRNYEPEAVSHRDLNREMDGEQQSAPRPGDPGWVNRARVPQPSNKDYVVRPRWNVASEQDNMYDDEDRGGDGTEEEGERARRRQNRFVGPRKQPGTTSSSSRIKGQIRKLTQTSNLQKKNRFVRAVPMSLEGRKMAL